MTAHRASRSQSFTCSTELLRAFEHRAFELGCSFDWLLEEAMQRLLADPRESARAPVAEVAAPTPMPALTLATPPPPPPPSRRARAGTRVLAPLVLAYGSERLAIDRHPYVIGRSASTADLVIEDNAVSRRHAVIEHTLEGWAIQDLGSKNGIIVNGEIVRHAVLRTGMVMTIGPLTFIVASP